MALSSGGRASEALAPLSAAPAPCHLPALPAAAGALPQPVRWLSLGEPRPLPGARLARVQLRGRGDFALHQARPLEAAQKPPELSVAVARAPLDHALEVSV